jgi:hypothetical protein
MENYDSTQDTLAHVERVQQLMELCNANLQSRQQKHDQSKLEFPEKEIFDRMTPKLKNSTYGSEEYKGFLKEMGEALDHHYANNSHHPEHFSNGIDGMSLMDLVEMICDWKAAGERHDNGSIGASLEHNKKRFKIGDQLFSVLKNTAKELKWMQ